MLGSIVIDPKFVYRLGFDHKRKFYMSPEIQNDPLLS